MPVQAEKRPSRMPFVISALLAAIVLYVQTAFGSSAAEPQGAARSRPRGNPASRLCPKMPSRPLLTIRPGRRAKGRRRAPTPQKDAAGQGLALTWDNAVRIGPVATREMAPAMNLGREPLPQGQGRRHIRSGGNRGCGQPARCAARPGAGHDAATPARPNSAPRPSGRIHEVTLTSGTFTAIALSDLLATFTDPDGDQLTVVDYAVSAGLLVPVGDELMYICDPDTVGQVELQYSVSDGQFGQVAGGAADRRGQAAGGHRRCRQPDRWRLCRRSARQGRQRRDERRCGA